MSWQPLAPLETVQARAVLYRQLRAFFSERHVLEVDVPVISECATVDPFIDSMMLQGSHPRYLQTSPEFFLKRFLAAYPTDCYSLGKAFREEECGTRHNPEFTLLEWYRLGIDELQLADEVVQLLQQLLPGISVLNTTYRELFLHSTGINPHDASVEELYDYAQSQLDISFHSSNKSTWLDLIFTHCVEPQLPQGIVVISDYPVSQAALARREKNAQGVVITRRFEVYIDGMELANGYWELTDASEQQQRFENDVQYRQLNNLPAVPYDRLLVDALREGPLPTCAGVALGIDRLLMVITGTKDIARVLTFR